MNEYVENEVHGNNLIDFVTDLRERMKVSMKLANENMTLAQDKSKQWYDKHEKEVSN